MHRTQLNTESLPRWLAEHALAGIRAKFPSPDYKFELERSQHIENRDCRSREERVHIVCKTNFAPPSPLVDAWRGKSELK